VEAEYRSPSPGAHASEQIDILETRLKGAAAKLQTSIEIPLFHILVDQIEQIWSNDKESDSMVVGLLLASKHIQATFDCVLVTVFLRTDIYEQLQFQDRDKFRGDEFHIEWDEPRLHDLILNRANASLGSSHSGTELWSALFPQIIEEKAAKAFLVGHTLMRPRDIIQLCNVCRDKARTNGHIRIETSDIREALQLYSNWKLSDLQNEWSVNYPFLPDIFVLFTNATYFVSRERFVARLEAIRQDLVSRYPTLLHGLSENELLSVLYSIGFLGVMRQGLAVYTYQDRQERRVRPEEVEFIIHPCFREALHSTSAINLSPFQGMGDDDYRALRDAFLSEIRIGKFPTLRGAPYQRITYSLLSAFDELCTVVEKTRFPSALR
jgi:hypothetical protein